MKTAAIVLAAGSGKRMYEGAEGLATGEKRVKKQYMEIGDRPILYYALKAFQDAGVDEIVLEGGITTGVKLADGSFVEADYVIPTVDTHILFNKMLPAKYMPGKLKEAYDAPKTYPATSGFQAAYAVSTEFKRGETIFIEIDPIRVGNRSFSRMYVKAYGYDPVCVKDGKQVIQTSLSQTDEDYEYWKSLSKEEYKSVKEALVQEVSKRIEEAFPELAGDLEFLDAWTPLTYERYMHAYHGSYMSFVTTPGGKQIKMKGQLKGIKNLYIAGQWTNSPGGLPVAAASGKFAIQRILKKQRRDINI